MPQFPLIPMPRSIRPTKGAFKLPQNLYIILDPHPATRDLFAAERFVLEAESFTTTHFHITVGTASIHPQQEIRATFDQSLPHDQAYHLAITPTGIHLTARTPAGTFYAFQTLLQLLRNAAAKKSPRTTLKSPNLKSQISNLKPSNFKSQISNLSLPCLTIDDHPDFPRRGVYHDCSRGKVPTVDTLLQLIDDLGHLKYNEFQLYIENVFEFRKHPEMYDDTTPFTAEEILLLDSACRARHIDFVPSLTSLGHFEKILSRPAFRHLAEVEPADLKKAGIKTWSDHPWTLCTTDPAARQFLKDMVDEFVPNFTSPQFNICCDESWDLGKGRSKKLADKIGAGQMYVDWINHCNSLAKSHGKRIQMWGDIILNHPDLIPQLPEDVTLLEWGYESHHQFDEHCKLFKSRLKDLSFPAPEPYTLNPIPSRAFYVAPGTASWLSLASRTRNALGNIHNAATAGLKHGAAGLLVTDWGDNGHQQLLAVSLLPFAYGAAASWNLQSVPNPAIKDPPNWETGIVPAGSKKSDRALAPFLHAASRHLFLDPSGVTAALAYDLGLTYERFSWQRFNGSLEWFLFREKWDFSNYVNRPTPASLRAVIAACEALIPQFQAAPIAHAHANELKAEFLLTCELIIHTCQRTLLRQQWLAATAAKRNPDHRTRSVSAGPSPVPTAGRPPAQAVQAETPANLPPQPQPLPKTFKPQMKRLAKEAAHLEKQYATLWLARNKPSRLTDILAEFQRLQKEYVQFR